MTSEIRITRPKSTGWLIFAAGTVIFGFGAFLGVGVGLTDARALWSFPFTAVYMAFVLLGLAAMIWGWQMAHNLKSMIFLSPSGLEMAHPKKAAMVQVCWADLALFEIWRPYAVTAGQRDQVSIGLTEDAADRLGLAVARPDPQSPGHTGADLPARKHFHYNAGQLSVGADDLQSLIADGVTSAGRVVAAPKTVHIGVAARFRWHFRDT